ncbi:MAG TPA: S9 family peptidase [Terriglobales bacterium]|jgi:dipeptidyl aminopeptidase/acylaminoacyl peptidase
MRKRTCIVFISCLLLGTAAAQTTTGKSKLTPQQAIAESRIRDLQWSPDDSRLAFVVTEPPKAADHPSHIWMYTPASHDLRQFTNGSKPEDHPRWSPDGKMLAFLCEREDFKQICVIPVDGGEAKPLTEGKRSITEFAWSPDGRQIAFLAPEPKTDAEEKKEKDKDDARVVDNDDKQPLLWLADSATGKAQAIVGKPWSFSELQWSPSADEVVAVATDHPESDQETNRIFSISIPGGKMRQIAAPKGPFEDIRVSPDGKQVAYIGCRVDGPVPHDLLLQSLSGGDARNLTSRSLDRPIRDLSWRSDGRLLIAYQDGFHGKFTLIDSSGHAEALSAPDMEVSDFAQSGAGEIAFSGENMGRPPELWVWDGKSSPASVSHFNESFDNVQMFSPEFVHYKSFDGREIEGALLRPPSGTQKLPTILVIHGGPTGNWGDSFESWGQLLVTAGYAVFYPNIRGSTGYGFDFMVLNRADWGGGDFKDVMAAADYLVAQGIADPGRMGIAGWSYGGYMSEWAITQTNRFKAAVSGAGMADLAAEYGTEEHPSYDEWFYGLPYEKPEGFRRGSPINYIRNAHTPTLILQGDADTIDPLGQSQQLYRALKRYGVETELVIYPREPHGLREEKHLLDRLNRIVNWFNAHLK